MISRFFQSSSNSTSEHVDPSETILKNRTIRSIKAGIWQQFYAEDKAREISGYTQAIARENATVKSYKLHLAIAIAAYSGIKKQVEDFLLELIRKGKLDTFKDITLTSEELTKNLQEVEAQASLNEVFQEQKRAKERLYANPITLYLSDKVDAKNLASLCISLESILSTQIMKKSDSLLSSADLPLTPHISFRQETLFGKYVTIAKASSKKLQQLRFEAENSSLYQALKSELKSSACSGPGL